MAELAAEKNATKKIEDQLESVKELYNRTTRESSKVSTELRQEQEKYRVLTENVNSSVNRNDQELYNLKKENRELLVKIEELEEENEDFRNRLNEKDDFARKAEEDSKLYLFFFLRILDFHCFIKNEKKKLIFLIFFLRT